MVPGALYALYYEQNDEYLLAAKFEDGTYRPLNFNGLNIYYSGSASGGSVSFDIQPSPAPLKTSEDDEIPVEFMDTEEAVDGSVPAVMIAEWEGIGPYEWYMQVKVGDINVFADNEESPLVSGSHTLTVSEAI